MTTLGELREGDRFLFNPKRVDVWEVIHNKVRGKIEVNQVDTVTKEKKFKYNEVKSANTKVMFLRHSKPLPGQECFLEDLEFGDVFFKPEDVITEYVLLNRLVSEPNHYAVRKVADKECKEPQMAGRLATVILVRKKEGGQQ